MVGNKIIIAAKIYEQLLCVRYYDKHLTYIISFYTHSILTSWSNIPAFLDEKTEEQRGKLGKAPKDRCQNHGGVRCSFNLPPLIYNSKTSLTQQMFLCPTHRDAGEFHTSVHLKVGGLEHIEETEPGKSRGGACDPGPLAMGTEPQRAW